MSKPTWRHFVLDAGVSREPSPDESCLVFWLRRQREGNVQHWERISNVLGAAFQVEQGLCAVAATSLPAQQRVGGFLLALLQPFRKQPRGPSWVLPTSGIAEQAYSAWRSRR
jgi:hypothetical protein